MRNTILNVRILLFFFLVSKSYKHLQFISKNGGKLLEHNTIPFKNLLINSYCVPGTSDMNSTKSSFLGVHGLKERQT